MGYSGPLNKLVIAIKGAGEMATGVAWRLYQSGFRNLYMLETSMPLAVRRKVCFSEAVYDGHIRVENIEARKAANADDIPLFWEKGVIPVVVDPGWHCLKSRPPQVVVDAIIAKKNLGTSRDEAELVIGLGPGFTAGLDVHRVVETNRGHDLGRVIASGCAQANTGVPGVIEGVSSMRLLRAPCSGVFQSTLSLGDRVKQGETIGQVDQEPVKAKIDGVLRGQIRTGVHVHEGCKIGDIDPRNRVEYCPTISEKARAIGGSVLEAILGKYNTGEAGD